MSKNYRMRKYYLPNNIPFANFKAFRFLFDKKTDIKFRKILDLIKISF